MTRLALHPTHYVFGRDAKRMLGHHGRRATQVRGASFGAACRMTVERLHETPKLRSAGVRSTKTRCDGLRHNVELTGDQGNWRAGGADALGRPCRMPCYVSSSASSPAAQLERSIQRAQSRPPAAGLQNHLARFEFLAGDQTIGRRGLRGRQDRPQYQQQLLESHQTRRSRLF
jgi:hypothetical protein